MFRKMEKKMFVLLMFVLLIGMIISARYAFAGNPRSVPVDRNGNIAASGSEQRTWWDPTTTDGAMHEILIPEGAECKTVYIQVVSSSPTEYKIIPFHHSSTGSELTEWTEHLEGLVMSIWKSSGSLGFVRAEAGYRVAIKALY